MNEAQIYLNQLSERAIGLAYKIGASLGCGFVESVYENALVHELGKSSIKVRQQRQILVRYDGIIIGDFQADLIIEEALIIEVKAVREISLGHEAQLLNYLKSSKLRLGLVINLGTSAVQIRRKVNGF